MAKHATIDEYIGELSPDLANIAAATRAIVDRHLIGAVSGIKWAQPVWSIGTDPVCYLKGASSHVTFGFWKGTSIDDPSGRLESGGQVMAHVKLRAAADVDEPLFAGWLRQARDLAES